jgi:hypothetical protein
MQKTWMAVGLAAVLTFWAAPAKGVVLFNDGTPDDIEGFYADPQNSPYVAYSDFTLPLNAEITGMDWYGFYFPGNTPPAADSFDYEFWSSPGGGGQPATLLDSGTMNGLSITDTGTITEACENYLYDATFSTPFVVAGGVQYYVAVYDTAVNPGNAFGWCESGTGTAETEWS